MSAQNSSSVASLTPRFPWWLAIALGSWAIGVVGFWNFGSWRDALYYSLQLFAFEPAYAGQEINPWIEVARWGAAFSVGTAVWSVARQLFRDQYLRARLRVASGHTLICADDDVALELARTLRVRLGRSRLWLITAGAATAETVRTQVPGFKVLLGRPEALISTTSVHRARQVIVAGADDSENMAIATQVCDLTRLARTEASPLVCQVQIQSVGLRESLRRFSVPAEQSHSYVRTFDFFEHAARHLLATTLPIDGGILEGDPRSVHLVLLGDNEWSLTVAACAARVGHFANRHPLRVSIVADNLADWERQLHDRFPAFGEVCQYKGVQYPARSHQALSWLTEQCNELDTHVRVVACPADDAGALGFVSDWSQVVRRPDVPLAVRLSRGGGLVSLLRERANADGMRVVPFGWFDESACASFLEDDEREEMAQLVQVRFKTMAEGQGRRQIVDRAVAEWAQVAQEDYKESNRQQVDHMPIKLRAVRCEVAPPDDPRPPAVWSHAEVELLAQMEHLRWVAERRLAGWMFAEGTKDEQARTNPNLAPWDRLSESVKDYDRDAVLNIPDLVREVMRQKICRAKTDPHQRS